MIDFRKFYAEVSAVAGAMMNFQEAVALFYAADGIVLEIGAWKGLSTVFLSRAADVVYSVDPHEGVLVTGNEPATWTEYGETIRKFAAPNVFTFRGASRHLPKRFLPEPNFVFIDGSHLEEDVAFDLSLVPKRCTLAVDDLGYPGVAKAFETWRQKRIIAPVDLRQYPIEDPAHNRLHEGFVGKMGIFRVTG